MTQFSIAIIAGGQSRRMGQDKALLRLDPGGPTFLQMVAQHALALSDDVLVVAPPERGYGDLLPGIPVIRDAIADGGPVAAVVTALRSASYSRVLMLPCDAPFLSRPLLRALAERCDGDRPVIGWRRGPSKQGAERSLETLHGVYPHSLLPQIEAMFAGGERRLYKIVERLEPDLVSPDWVERFDPGMKTFASMNSPADLAAYGGKLFAGD